MPTMAPLRTAFASTVLGALLLAALAPEATAQRVRVTSDGVLIDAAGRALSASSAESVDELAARSAAVGTRVVVGGPRGGTFRVRPSCSPDGVLTFAIAGDPSGAAGCVEREYAGPIDVRWAGAVADDGLDDRAAIQAAIDAAAAAGDGKGGATVRLAEGVYDVAFYATGSDSYYGVILRAGVTITGGTLHLLPNQTTSAAGKYYFVTNLDGAGGHYDNVTIDNVTIDANGDQNQVFLVADAVTLVGDNVVLRNSYVKDAPDSGVMFSQVRDSAIENNRIEGYAVSPKNDVGIYVNDGVDADEDLHGDNFYQNRVSGNRISGFRYGGIAMKRFLSRAIIEGNLIRDTGNGITFENASTSSDYSTDNLVVNNRLWRIGYNAANGGPEPGKMGINLRGSSWVTVANNRVEDGNGFGIAVNGSTHNTFTGNVVSYVEANRVDGQHTGIKLFPRDGVQSDYNTFVGNVVTGGAWQVDLDTQTLQAITGNAFVANQLADGEIGIRVAANASANTFMGNVSTASAPGYDYSYTAALGANAWVSNRAAGTGTIAGSVLAPNRDYLVGGMNTTGNVVVGMGGATTQLSLGNLGLSAPTIGFGTANDVKLYRNGTNLLALEAGDSFRVQGAGYLEVGGPRWISGSGSPEGVVTAPVGSMYTRTDGGAGTTFYVKESGAGSSGWTAK